MSRVQEIERAIEQLPRDEAFLLADWISSRISKEWDHEIEEDIKAGRLDHLAQQAVSEFRAGRTSPAWHGDVLAERDRLIASGEEKFMDWETAKRQLRETLS